RCIILFQVVDDLDVMLFGLNVYEYGEDYPESNRGRAYISFPDSVSTSNP
ncbi:unnamed protein product, partial [Scytosiphon promiscuus]